MTATSPAALAELRDDDDVLAADVDSVVTVADAAQDAYWPAMWGLRNIFAGTTRPGS